MTTSFYSEAELATLGLKSYGSKVLISRFTRIYAPEQITIGDNVRIDDFCILSGNITIGSNIHIAAYCALYGGECGIVLHNYAGLSARCTIYSTIDDFSGEYLIGPMVDSNLRKLESGKVVLESYTQVGANSVVFPSVILREGTAIGAMSLVKTSTEPWTIYAGSPAKKTKNRSCNLLKLSKLQTGGGKKHSLNYLFSAKNSAYTYTLKQQQDICSDFPLLPRSERRKIA